MAEINEVIERVTADLNRAIEVTRDRNVKFTIHAGDATKLLDEIIRLQTRDNWSVMDHERMQAELETVRAERDALRAALEAVRGECNWDYHSLDAMLRNITHIVDTALNTQPQAEWTPRRMQIKTGYSAYFYRENKQTALTFQDGDIVIAGETDHNGTHVRNLEDNAGALIPTEYLAPVDESEAQAEWTPRLGERVRVKENPNDGNSGEYGIVIQHIEGVGSPYRVRFTYIESGDEWNEVYYYKADQLELAD